MKNMGKVIGLLIILIINISIVGCSNLKKESSPIDPEDPVKVTIWHYYNGHIKDRFDTFISEFNKSVGKEKGIIVEAKSQGDVDQLATEVLNAANQMIGSKKMPDMFAAYPDSAFQVNQLTGLVSLDEYFSEEELSEYRQEFLEEGRFLSDDNIYIMPVAKSTENLFINKTHWQEFRDRNKLEDTDIDTWEGLVEVSKLYHSQTGEAFFGIDANANYMMVASAQLGEEIFKYGNDSAEINLSEKVGRKIWENYYIPYINGYFKKTGRFSTDDARTGQVIAYTGSTAGASYFPTQVTLSKEDVIDIEMMARPYPHFKDARPVAIQQGAGICITRSDETREYASAEFLRWFTDIEQNLKFSIPTGYFPVKDKALKEQLLIDTFEKEGVKTESIKKSIRTTSKMFEEYELYNSKSFKGSYEVRRLLETHLYEKVQRDLEELESNGYSGQEKDKKIEDMISEEEFQIWYSSLVEEADKILKKIREEEEMMLYEEYI